MPRPPKRGAPGSRAGSGRRGPQTCCRGCPSASSQTFRLIKVLVKYATGRLVSTDAFKRPRSPCGDPRTHLDRLLAEGLRLCCTRGLIPPYSTRRSSPKRYGNSYEGEDYGRASENSGQGKFMQKAHSPGPIGPGAAVW